MPTYPTTIGNDVVAGGSSDDTLRGGYGNDALNGGGGEDELDGGRGNDTLAGGTGNDEIVSRSDGGEGAIAQAITATNDPNGEVDLTSRRIYAGQAGLPADDVLTGGAGADEFEFQTLINAKAEIIRKHTEADGDIDWAGVAGENNLVHDHWVDGIGNDVITDFNQAEGDTIEIEGHTTEVYKIEVKDADGDGTVDDTVLHLRSNQGNAGAHHLDLLGTVTVLNNTLTKDDFEVDANSTAGIVKNISQLQEAIAPMNPSAGAQVSDTGGSAASGPGAGEATQTGGMTAGGYGMVGMSGATAAGQTQASGGAAVSTTTSMGNDVITGGSSDDTLRGGYGNDALNGGGGEDELDGGRGNDTLAGGTGNDEIVSRSDGGETAIAQAITATNDPNSEVDLASRRIYAGQAGLPADDVLTGGAGADEFEFKTLINAKAEILRKHADENGVIDYGDVAGENNLVHDHWVDGIGNDVITDFNQAEGDTIEIEGHTTEVYKIELKDADGDGTADDTVLHLRSNQGNAGAHHLDLLGTISVLNNKLTEDDFEVDANSTAGIVKNISQLQEAIAPMNPASVSAASGAGSGATGSGSGGQAADAATTDASGGDTASAEEDAEASSQGAGHACGTPAAETQVASDNSGAAAGATAASAGHAMAHGSSTTTATTQVASSASSASGAGAGYATESAGGASTATAAGAQVASASGAVQASDAASAAEDVVAGAVTGDGHGDHGSATGAATGSGSGTAQVADSGTATSDGHDAAHGSDTSAAAGSGSGTDTAQVADAGTESADTHGGAHSEASAVAGSTGAGSAAGSGTGATAEVADAGSGAAAGEGANQGGSASSPAATTATQATAATPAATAAATGPLASLANNWGDSILDGNEGADHMHGGHGDDVVSGHAGDDRLTGDYGDDILLGGAGADRMSGDRGEDVLFGGAGNDVLEGGSSNDVLMGAAGSDTIHGGTGLDTLLLSDGMGEYMIAVIEDGEVRIADSAGGIDVVTGVEYYRFLEGGDTYVVENGVFTRTADAEAVDELLSGHLLEELIQAEATAEADAAVAAQAGGSASAGATASVAAAAGSASAAATPASTHAHDDGTVHTHCDLLAA